MHKYHVFLTCFPPCTFHWSPATTMMDTRAVLWFCTPGPTGKCSFHKLEDSIHFIPYFLSLENSVPQYILQPAMYDKEV